MNPDFKCSPDGSAGGDGPAPAPETSSSSGGRGRGGTFVIRGQALNLQPQSYAATIANAASTHKTVRVHT